MRNRRFAAVAGLLVLLLGAFFLHQAHPSHPPARPVSPRFRAYLADPASRMVAYSPEPDAGPEDIAAALTVLRTKFDGLSLYGCDTQTLSVVDTARRLHFHAVLLTVWDPRAESELAIASSIIRDSWQSLDLAVSIGSEGLMQQRYTFADMQAARAELLERSTQATTVEMTTTEPWWLYLKPESAALRTFGDFTSVNVHVIWDTDIASPALAATWTRDRAAQVAAAVTRPVLLRESGFPGGGHSPRQASELTFTRQLQRDYWAKWITLSQIPPTVFFEGVDNQSKHWQGFEAAWGFLHTDLRPWPVWTALPELPR